MCGALPLHTGRMASHIIPPTCFPNWTPDRAEKGRTCVLVIAEMIRHEDGRWPHWTEHLAQRVAAGTDLRGVLADIDRKIASIDPSWGHRKYGPGGPGSLRDSWQRLRRFIQGDDAAS